MTNPEPFLTMEVGGDTLDLTPHRDGLILYVLEDSNGSGHAQQAAMILPRDAIWQLANALLDFLEPDDDR